MRSSLLLLLACLTLVMMAGEADAKNPEWSYTAEGYVVVDSVAISADGEYIVAGSQQNDTVYLFNKDSNTPLWSYLHAGSVNSVALSVDGEYIAAGAKDTVYLFDKNSSTPLWSYEMNCDIYSIDMSADGEYIIAGGCGATPEDDKLYFFDKDSNTPLWTYNTGDSVASVAISADGEYIVAGTAMSSTHGDDKIYVFDKDSSTPLWSYNIEGHQRLHSITISADGEYIAAGWGYNVSLFDKESSTPLWSSQSDEMGSVAISADGEYIIAGQHGNVYFFDKDSSTPLWSYTTGGGMNSVAISADGEYIVAGAGTKVYLFDKDSSTPLWSYEDEHSMLSVAISANGEYTVAGDEQAVHLLFTNQPPIATLDSISPSPARFKNEVITFNGSGFDNDGTVTNYQWTSDLDGFLSDEEDFSITGFSVGTHTISFRVQDNDGEWSEWDNTTVVIYPNTPPVCTIDSITPSPARFDTEVTFSGSGSDSDGTIVAYLWESSIDGEIGTEEDFSISDLSLGHHTITFRVQDNDGAWSDSPTSGGNGSVPGNQLWIYAVPVAIAGQDSTGTPGVPLQFSGAATDEDGTIAKYEWDFDGDGVFEWSSPENGRELNIYNNEGTYTATLRVTDNDGFTDTDTVEVTISEKKIQIDDEGNVTVTDTEEDEEGIPTLSVITTMAAVAVMALRRRPE